MQAQVFWVEGPWRGRLGILPRPRGGDWLGDETAAWRAAGVDVVVSLLEAEEEAQLILEGEAEPPRPAASTFEHSRSLIAVCRRPESRSRNLPTTLPMHSTGARTWRCTADKASADQA